MAEYKITPEMLKERGWEEKNDGPSCIFDKKIPNSNPLNASEDTDLRLVLHAMFGQAQFAVLLPDGGMLNLNIESIDDLDKAESLIAFYDAPF